jgi:YegS/Rv2252/BmrU family lipid kinase
VPPSAPRTVRFVLNPAAAGGRARRRWCRIEPQVRSAFPQAELHETSAPGEATTLAADAARSGVELVVAVGGDGTLHEVLQGLMTVDAAARPVLGLLPAGSGSDFARGMAIPADPEQALALLVEGEARAVDVGLIDAVDEAGEPVRRFFLNGADFGLGATVVARMRHRPRLLPAKLAYHLATVRTLLGYRNPTATLRVDGGEPYPRVFKSVVVANAPFFGGGMCIAPDAVVDDGELDLVELGDLGRLEAIRRLRETYLGGRIAHEDIHYSRCRNLYAESPSRVMIQADGEAVGCLPATFDRLPASLRVLLPPRP